MEYQDTGKKRNKAGWLPPQLMEKEQGNVAHTGEEHSEQYNQMKSNWTKQFVEQHGIEFVVNQVLTLDFSQANQTTFELKNKSFLLTLLRVFIIAAIASQPNQDTSGSELLRRKSSLIDDEEKKDEARPAEEA